MSQMQRLPRWWRNPPAKQEMQIWPLNQEDHLEKETETHLSILAWEIPRIESGRPQPMGSQRDRHDWAHTETDRTLKGNYTPIKINLKKKYTRLGYTNDVWMSISISGLSSQDSTCNHCLNVCTLSSNVVKLVFQAQEIIFSPNLSFFNGFISQSMAQLSF